MKNRPTKRTKRPLSNFDTYYKKLITDVLCLFSGIFTIELASAQVTRDTLDEITVTAALLNAVTAPVSASVLTERIQNRRGAAHLEDIITLAPNVASSSGASRSRFFQIRGIGERSQFVEPVNPSVGILLDGIDLSGAGGALTLFDIQQVEVLRGPQGTLMGANALAGLIAVKSNGTGSVSSNIGIGLETKGGYRLGARWGGDLSDGLQGRIALQHYESDGYVDNQYLGRNDTNSRKELTARGTLTWASAIHTVEAAVYFTGVDNGYDAFSLDNTRTTLSDQPGEDDLTLKAGRLNWHSTLMGLHSLLQVSHASTDTTYSYDEDWSYVGIAPGWEYSSYDEYFRDRSMSSFEWRLQAPESSDIEWVVGTYLRDESEDLIRAYTYLPGPFTSTVDTQTLAIFGQINRSFNEQLSGFIGARLEQRDTNYFDSADVEKDFDFNYWTGRLGLIWHYEGDGQVYATVSRGARAGGANPGLLSSIQALPEQNQSDVSALGVFDEETLVSLEIGWQVEWPAHTLLSNLSLFTMYRDDQQAKGSLVIPRLDGSTAFIDYTDNAVSSEHRGLEWELKWHPSERMVTELTLGLLDAKFDRYLTATGANLSGRDQPQAPKWQYSAGLTWQISALASAQVEIAGSDDYFFSDRHDVRAPKTHQVNASLSGKWRRWQWILWGRNLANETTVVRGFGTFGNDPRKGYALEPYLQYGEPRMLGLSLSYDLMESR